MRLDTQPHEEIDRSQPITFRWNGADHAAYAGDTIASALAAGGVRVVSRSFKYHRPRGIMTASFNDPNCLFQLGDEPNVRGAHRRVEAGMDVRTQNVWPSLRFDAKAINQAVGRFLPPGFYYKTFMAPQRLLPIYQQVLRRFSPGGSVRADPFEARFDHRYVHPDVLVAGGGPAGMSAAVAAANVGARVLLVEEEYELGGHLRWSGASPDVLRQLRAAVAAAPNIEVMTNSTVTGCYDDNWIAIAQRDHPGVDERLIKARAKVLVVAPGLIERPYVFAGNDKPGVMLSSAVQRLVNLYAVRPGRRAVVLTANADGDEVVNVLERAGVTIAGVVDARSGGDVVRAVGRGGVRAVDLPNGTRLDADLLVTATGWTAPTALLNMAGTTVHYEPRAARFFPSQLPGSVLATGGIVGDGSIDELLAHGQAVGSAAAQRSARLARQWRSVTPTAAVVDKAEVDSAPVEVPALPIDDHPALFRSTTHGIVDFSEDVSSNDIMAAAREGYDSIELAKRYTTATMGLTQGKLELMNAIAVHAEATGRTIEETGTTTWRPPYTPLSLGALAGRAVDPVAVSPMHSWHIAHGASPLIAGQWIRPDHYGDAEGEVRNVRENVGIIDVTPLGKFDLRGPDVSNLLNLLYVNRWSKLAVGSVRYGVMCGHDGVVLDDGVTGRLAEDRYMLTTTSSGPEVVWRWMEEWLQTEHPRWRIHITPATNTYASINVAGPKARELMQRLVEGVDLEPSAFPYMRVRMGRIAGVDECFMWRIGFTGELSYELHVPAAYGLYVWETLLEAGDGLGIRPFGIEAQRIMRLEKGHLLVAQDTDGLTQGFGASLGGLIKLEKSTFVGKPELVWQQAHNEYLRLVGLQPDDGTIVPDEGSQLVEDVNTIVGRVTSSRMSPTLGRSICLGFVTPALTEPGSKVTIQLPDGRRVPATVTENLAHFDPEGARLRG